MGYRNAASIAKQCGLYLCRANPGVRFFLFTDSLFLCPQLYDGDRLSPALLGLKRMFLNQRMRSQELANPPAECARSVSMNNPDSRLVRQRGVIQEFVQPIRGFFYCHADHVDFIGGGGFPALQ